MAWTKEQTEAIEKSGSLLVAAAAGSGKTAVLTERIVLLITLGADVSDFLVVTFTRAAAGEMKKRVGKRLFDAAAEATEKDAQRLYRAATAVGQANISTMHAFCAQVLRRHFHTVGIDPAFRIADDADVAVMREDALDELFEEYLEANETEFKKLCDMFHPYSALREALLSIHKFMYSKPDPFLWLEQAVSLYRTKEEDILSLPHMVLFSRECRRKLAQRLEAYARARDLICGDYPDMAQKMDEELVSLREALRCEDIVAYRAALSRAAFPTMQWPRGTPDEVKKPVQDARGKCKDVWKAQLEECLIDPHKEAERMAFVAERLETLQDFLQAFSERMAQKKTAARVVDYNDLEHLTLRLFENEAVAAEYREKFRYIFVDEYQDSNTVQESILKKICRADNLFFVGDVKQSIYRFRLAEPGLFLEKYARYGKNEGGSRIDLNANFRSAKNVVDTVNAVFSRAMRREGAEIDYDERAALVFGRGDGAEGSAELCLIERGSQGVFSWASSNEEPVVDAEDETPDGEREEGTESESARLETADMEDAEVEARVAARRIHTLMKTMRVPDAKSGALRPLRYSDIAVLHRAPRRAAQTWVETLSAQGVPAYAQLRGGYFDAVEVQVFLDLLRVLDNRRQDIPLAAVLRSPIGGFSTEELIELRSQFKNGLLFDALTQSLSYDTPLAKKAADFLQKISRWHDDAGLCGLEELLGRLFEETGYYDFVTALPGGPSRQKNLDALFSMARAYEANGARGLTGFLSFMDRIKNTDAVGEAQTAGADVVRVMSIHASKGLEFPVVFLAGMSSGFNRTDTKSRLILDGAYGIGLRPILNGACAKTLLWRGVRESRHFADTAEQMRLLYVGMTRARDALIMLATVKSTEETLQKALVPLTPLSVSNAGRFLDWALGALMDTPCANAVRQSMGLKALEGASFCTITAASPEGGMDSFAAVDEGECRAFFKEAAKADTSAFDAQFSWRYPYEKATRLPSKLSVTGLSQSLPALRETPDFFAAKTPTPAERGTATHLLMEYISIRPHTTETVQAEISSLLERGILTKEQSAVISAQQVAGFFASTIGQRLINAKVRERELEFNCRIPASELLENAGGEPILLQGVIDCCFLEDDAWVLLDYKTDYIPLGTSVSEAAQKHQKQLGLYARALSILTNKPVKERFVHFLRTGESVSL